MRPIAEYRFEVTEPYDLAATARMLAMGPLDPTVRIDGPGHVRLGQRTAHGTAMLAVTHAAETVRVRLFSDESHPPWSEATVHALLGLHFTPSVPAAPPRLRTLARQHEGMRLPRRPQVFTGLTQAVLQQLIAFRDASHGFRTLVQRHGTPLAGTPSVFAPPSAADLLQLTPADLVACGILPTHARRLLRLARDADRIEASWGQGLAPDAIGRTCRQLATLTGVGPWTTGYVQGTTLGDPDAVVLGDYGFPERVAWFFGDAVPAAADGYHGFRSLPHR